MPPTSGTGMGMLVSDTHATASTDPDTIPPATSDVTEPMPDSDGLFRDANPANV